MRSVLWLSVILAWGAAACGTEESTFELNSRRIGELANATCACSDSVSKRDCAATYQAVLNATLVAQVEAGRVRVRSELWADCIAELQRCRNVAPKCERLFEGLRTKGQACDSSSLECAPGLRCVPDEGSDPDCPIAGTCRELKTVERGERCSSREQCEDDDICGADTDVARPPADAGVEPDEDGGVEAEPEGEVETVCQRPLEEGDACPTDELGLAGAQLCEPGLGCVPEDDALVCGEPRKEGERCSFAIDDQSVMGLCIKGTFCGAAGVCERFPFPEGAEEGEDCDVREDCLPGLVCVKGECSIPLANGERCDGPGECAARCKDSRCVAAFVACDLQ